MLEEVESMSWEDITSTNSLADVVHLQWRLRRDVQQLDAGLVQQRNQLGFSAIDQAVCAPDEGARQIEGRAKGAAAVVHATRDLAGVARNGDRPRQL